MHDYQVPRGFIPSKSFRPTEKCKTQLDPMEDETTHKADYVDWHSRGPQGPFPWTPGNKFMHPTIPMNGDTTYKTDYTNNGMGDRRMPILPKGQGIGIFGNTFDGCTTYKHDYIPWECVNEYDYNSPQEMVKCYKLEGETCQDPDKKLWCYKSNDVCPYYPPKPIDGVLAGTTQYVVRPSEGENPCVAPQPSFNTCDSKTQSKIPCPPAVAIYNSNDISCCQNGNSYSHAPQPANQYTSRMHESKDYNYSAHQPCGPDNYNYSVNQPCRPSKQETENYNHGVNQTCGTENNNYSIQQPCGSSKRETKYYTYDKNQTCEPIDYNYSAHQPCGTNNYNYMVNQPCRPSKQETENYNTGANQTCGMENYSENQPCGTNNYNYVVNQPCRPSKRIAEHDQICGTEDYNYSANQPCGSSKKETKNYTYNTNQICGSAAQGPQITYAPFEECQHKRQEAKPTSVANNHDPCHGVTSQYKPKETCETAPSKPYYSIGQKFDQNCACMTQPTGRFTTQEERVLTVHC